MSAPTVSTRRDLVRDQLAHLPLGTLRRPQAAPVRVGKVGTGDDLLVLAWSADDLARERAAGVRMLRALGLDAGARIANALPGALETPGALLLGDMVEELGALDVPLGVVETPAAAAQAWELLDRVEPAVLVLEAASASALLAGAPAARRPWWRGILWLRRGAAAVPRPALPAALAFDGWQRTWLAVPEAACVVGWSCARERLHVDAGVRASVADGTLVVEGPAGLLFQSGVAVRSPLGPCPCGAAGTSVELG